MKTFIALLLLAFPLLANTYIVASSQEALLETEEKADYAFVGSTPYKFQEGDWVKQEFSEEVRGEKTFKNEEGEEIVLEDAVIQPSLPNFIAPRPFIDADAILKGVPSVGGTFRMFSQEKKMLVEYHTHGAYEGDTVILVGY